MALKNNYARLVLYALISAILMIILRFIMTFIKVLNEPFYLLYSYILFTIQGLVGYFVIAFFNVLFLNKIKFEYDSSFKHQIMSYFIYSALYLVCTSIFVKTIVSFYSYIVGLGFDFFEILAFMGLAEVAYILIVPSLYIKYQSKLKKLKWF